MDDNSRVPLCVDLDDTLIKTDLLWESFLSLVRAQPWAVLLVPIWLLKGRAHLKRSIARRTKLHIASLPYRDSLLRFLGLEKAAGREVLLVTAGDEILAREITEHLPVFSGYLASDGMTNLKGAAKASMLVGRFGSRGFDYVGDGTTDLPIWKHARKAFLAESRPGLREQIERETPVEMIFDLQNARLPAMFRALRPHQWAKNLIVLVPILTSHKWLEVAVLRQGALAFLVFSLTASAVYIINDLLDLEADRLDTAKKMRPFAAGLLPVPWGIALALALLGAALPLAIWVGGAFALILGVYLLSTLAYSLFLKRVALLDVLVLAGLYTLRMLAGGAATAIPVSIWLLAFSMFFFFCLAMVKRYSELLELASLEREAMERRGYRTTDLDVVAMFGIGSGFSAVLILGLYVKSPEFNILYGQPATLFLGCPLLLYWITRVWLLARRGLLHKDPVMFALTDRASYACGALFLLLILLASL